MKRLPACCAALMLALGCASCDRPLPVESVAHGRFAQVRLYVTPVEASAQAGFALVFSATDGWDADADRVARELSAAGVLVAGVDMNALARAARAEGDDCLYAAGDLDNLARYLQAYRRLPGYFPPVLVGVGSGAAWAYAMLAQSEPDQFAGALAHGFSAEAKLPLPLPLCAGGVLQPQSGADSVQGLPAVHALPAPWIWLDDGHSPANQQTLAYAASGQARRVPVAPGGMSAALVAQFRALAAAHPPSGESAAIPGLPLIELPAQAESGSAAQARTLAILISGDGGWASLDRDVGEALQKRGVSVVGWDSLRYFWRARTPQGFAQDLQAVIEHYRVQWRAQQVLLIGYSQGANVMPFGYNRLPEALRSSIARVILMGLGERAAFEFHVTAWLGKDAGEPVTPELQRMRPARPLCVYGKEEADSLCPHLDAGLVEHVEMPGGHHFDTDYERLAQRLIAAASARS